MVPKLFRIALQVSDLDQAAAFYAKLLDDKGVRIPRGSRHYFDCGPVILAVGYQLFWQWVRGQPAGAGAAAAEADLARPGS